MYREVLFSHPLESAFGGPGMELLLPQGAERLQNNLVDPPIESL